MTSVSRIFVIEDDDHIGQQIVNALRNDGYGVWGVTNGGDAVRALWSEEYDAVICDLDAPGIEGFELLQWLRAYRPNTRMVVLGGSDAEKMRMQSLENGAASYLEKPLDVRALREELRRLQDDTGFMVDLDSFDLLDVIQIITMSRKNIALLVNTGLEERGTLRFQNGELVWAEYGFLRGEEAFFALAAHKNGTVTHQPWNGQVIPNVKLPLSRLIMQALQYRAKYGQGDAPQPTGSQPALNALSVDEEDDTPFGFVAPTDIGGGASGALPFQNGNLGNSGILPTTGGMDGFGGQFPSPGGMPGQFPLSDITSGGSGVWPVPGASGAMPVPDIPPATNALGGGSGIFPAQAVGQQMPASGLRDVVFGPAIGRLDEEGVGMEENEQKEWWERTGELPRLDNAAMHEFGGGNGNGTQPAAGGEGFNGETQLFAQESLMKTPPVSPDPVPLPSWLTDQPTASNLPVMQPGMMDIEQMKTPTSSGEWVAPDASMISGPIYATGPQSMLSRGSSGQPVAMPEPTNDVGGETIRRPSITNHHLQSFQARNTSGSLPMNAQRGNTGSQPAQSQGRKVFNYPALVSALQTLGYSVKGFISAAVVGLDGQPIAQVSVDDTDVTPICAPLSAMMKSAQQGAELGNWGGCEDVLLRNAGRYIMARIVGSNRSAFLVVITTREADPVESLHIVANIESAVNAALA